jgi:hypothetical protein
MIDSVEDTLLAFSMGGIIAYFTVRGPAPLNSKQTDYTPIVVNKLLHRWGLDCNMVEKSADFNNFILP